MIFGRQVPRKSRPLDGVKGHNKNEISFPGSPGVSVPSKRDGRELQFLNLLAFMIGNRMALRIYKLTLEKSITK